MSENNLYSKPILFAVVAFVAIMVGTVVTTLYPLLRSEMHPQLGTLTPYTAIELAGREIYQREGCISCHSQNVRALKADVLRYGEYSKAGENTYERPFLWGSRRTGPDLGRIGGKYADEWHLQHFVNPQKFAPDSNMPPYTWLADRMVNSGQTEASMKTLGMPYTAQEISVLSNVSELHALIAYMQKIGTAVETEHAMMVSYDDYTSYANSNRPAPDAALGRNIYIAECSGCHGLNGTGNISTVDFTDSNYEVDEGIAFVMIANGIPGLMPHFANVMTKDQITAIIAYMQTLNK